MPETLDLPASSLVAMTRESLLALRAALFRDLGANAASVLQEAGFAGGPAFFDAFGTWLSTHGHGAPENLAASEFATYAAEFFHDTGWGSIELGTLANVAVVDSPDWAESDPARPLDFPGCYYTSGILSDFFGRLAGQAVAVMEVECRSMGGERCRFLVGSGEVLQRVYDAMAGGVPYEEALGTTVG